MKKFADSVKKFLVSEDGPTAVEYAVMLALISRMNASAVVLDLSAGPFRTHDQLRQLLAAARCPLLVLGANQGEPSIAHTTQVPPAP